MGRAKKKDKSVKRYLTILAEHNGERHLLDFPYLLGQYFIRSYPDPNFESDWLWINMGDQVDLTKKQQLFIDKLKKDKHFFVATIVANDNEEKEVIPREYQ